MARVETIVVGGGIGAGSPFALNAIPYIASFDPPLLVSSPNMLQVPTGNIGIAISPTGVDPDPTGTEILRVSGGITSIVPGTNNRAWGDDISIEATRQGCLAVGRTITIAATSGNDCKVFGDSISTSSGTNVLVGRNITVGTGYNAPNYIYGIVTLGNGSGGVSGNNLIIAGGGSIGAGTVAGNIIISNNALNIGTASFANCIIGDTIVAGNGTSEIAGVGRSLTISASVTRSVAFGGFHTLAHSNCILIGQNLTTTAAGQCIIGDNLLAAGITTVILGKGDTSATPPAVTLRLTNESGADQPGANFTIRPGMGTGSAATGGSIIFQTGAVGGAGSTLQTPTTRLTIGQADILAAVPLEMQVDNGYRASAQTDAAGAAAGTLANAPTAGDPTHWLRVVINGANFAIPAWPVP